MGMGCGIVVQKNVFCALWAKEATENLLLTKWSHYYGLCTVVTLGRWLSSLVRLHGVSLQENYSKVGLISQEEFQAQREAMSSRPPEGEEADDMVFQMDEQPSTLLPQTSPPAMAVENSIVSEGSDSMEASAMLEETSQKKSPPSSPLRFYPLPDKSETSAAKDKVCGVNAAHRCIQILLCCV